VLVYAHRRELEHHGAALAWLRRLAEGPMPWAIPVFCLGEFVRVVTHARVFDPPSTLDQTLSALDALLQSPSLRVLSPEGEYPKLFIETVRAADARGNLVFDAQIASLCAEHGVSSLLTFDRDFSRFRNLRVIAPGEAPTEDRS
jgi:toxin-antitoxin system PIN domain toxin